MAEEEELRKMEVSEADIPDLRGDVLESILCYVPLIHLLSPCHVSKSWNHAVFSSLRHFNKPKPWLIVYSQNSRRSPHAAAATALAYDQRSNLWLRIINQNPPLLENVSSSPLRSSSNSNLLYMLSLSKFSFSFDPLNLTWHHVDPPRVCRTDPIVAVVGSRHIVVAGGACDFEDDPLSVEIYDLVTREWARCDHEYSMPAVLKDSAASTWLSIAAGTNKLYAMEQVSGITYSFDPSTRVWSGPFDPHRDHPNIYFSVIGIFGDGNMIMVGLIRNSENVKGVKVWELKGESFEFCKEIGVMPEKLVEKLKGEQTSLGSIKICSSSTTGVLYIYNPEEADEIVVCEIDGGEGVSKWGILKNAAVNDWSRVAGRIMVTCADVGLGDLGKAVGSGKGSFSIVNNGILR